MTEQEFLELYQNMVANITDQSVISEGLTRIQEHINNSFVNVNKLNSDLEKLTGDNENLRRVNMDFMLRLGSTNNNDPEPPTPPTPDNGDGIKIEDLFDEKGGLK